jgi:hypothetical protein
MLRKRGWTVEVKINGNSARQWTATHKNVTEPILFKQDANVQRVLDEAATKLGETPGRNTNGESRKRNKQKQRQRAAMDEHALTNARRRAQHHVYLFSPRARNIPKQNINLTDTKHALERAAERGITGAMIQDAIVNPIDMYPGYNDRMVLIGKHCKVVLSMDGAVITVGVRNSRESGGLRSRYAGVHEHSGGD